MNRVPDLTESEVQNWVGTKSFQKGYRYFEDETILNPRRRGQSLIAECQGSQSTPYRVEIRLGADGILEGSCTCTAGEGGRCKHAAALMLTWLHEPDLFVEVPELDKLLENRSKAELISLIQQMVSRHPDLEQVLELYALNNLALEAPLQSDLIAQQVRRAFSSTGGDMGGDNAEVADNLQPILDLGEDLLDREDTANAATVYQTLMDTMLSYDACLFNDEGGDLGQVLAECEQGIEDCLASTTDPDLRLGLLRSLFELFLWDIQAGGLGFADETPHVLTQQSTREEKREVAEWVKAELPEGEDWDGDHQRRALGGLWLGLMAEDMDDETYLRICRETGRTRDMTDRLLQLGRVDDALATARLAGSSDITRFADLFENHGYSELAVQIVKEQPNSETQIPLLEWLKTYAITHAQPEEALRLAGLLFWQAQSLENYNALLEAADALNQRDATRAQVLERLENAGNFSLLVEIYVVENEYDLALTALERVNPDIWWGRLATLRRQVAQAVETPRPREAIRQYLLLVDQLIEQRTRGSFAEAAHLLLQVHALNEGLGEEDDWNQLIGGLKQEYQHLPALMDELRRVGL
ncbi:MAG TPA: SWIM zinc finger family protein [Anaerolineaceae bacterium]